MPPTSSVRAPNGSRLSCGREAAGAPQALLVIATRLAHKWNSTLLARARQLQALDISKKCPQGVACQ